MNSDDERILEQAQKIADYHVQNLCRMVRERDAELKATSNLQLACAEALNDANEKLRVAVEALSDAAEVICLEVCTDLDASHVQYHCNGCIRNREALAKIRGER